MSEGRCCCGRVTGLNSGERSRINDRVHARLGDANAFCGPWWRHEIQDGEAEITRLRARVAKLEKLLRQINMRPGIDQEIYDEICAALAEEGEANG